MSQEKHFKNKVKIYPKIISSFLKKNLSNEVLGVPDLNLINYRSNINESKKKIFFIKKLKNFILNLFDSRNTISNLLKKRKFKNLILSHLVSINHISSNNDFYFGELAHKLGKDDTLIVLINHINLDKKTLKKKLNGNYIVLSKSLNFFLEIALYIKTTLVLFKKNFNIHKVKTFKITSIFFSVLNQRISIQTSKIVKDYDIQNVYFTYEGQPFEKLLCKELNFLKHVKSFGYQFSILRKFNYSIFLDLGKNYFPTKIFTINKFNKKILNQKLKYKVQIENIGFLRKHKFLKFKKKKNKKKKDIKILVIPEGILDEIKILFEYCNNNYNKNIKFTFRLHPIFENNKIVRNLINSKNIILSRNSIKHDLLNNEYVLYRGSSLIINAINNGLKPIYLHLSNEISIDPLFFVNKNYQVFYNQPLINFLKIKSKKLNNEYKKIREFAIDFYKKPRYERLIG